MEKVVKNLNILNRLKWMSIAFGGFMCLFLSPLLGETWSVILGTLAGLAFIIICENGKKGIVSDHVAADLKEALEGRGWKESIFEIKSLRPGMIIRIYLIKAGEKAISYNRVIMEKIERSWYKDMVWMTQLVNVNSEAEVDDVRATLDEELLESLRRMKNDGK